MTKFMQKYRTVAPSHTTEMQQKLLKYGNEILDVEIFQVSITEPFWFIWAFGFLYNPSPTPHLSPHDILKKNNSKKP
jgi:hypothetical protein